ncbi:penicillin-binding transpeptidase domain-containing protein [Pedococcus sp. NPDC057267]|uniref:penicillin-binding transpeptidase domain-containing protein n=1 Tax=Pedococcus sp. NPDC057267 TaxID=3346077 RepID=UPI003640836D
MDRRGVVGAVAAVAVVAAGGAGFWWWRHDQAGQQADRGARAEVAAYASGWSQRSFAKAGTVFTSPAATVQADFTRATSGLGSGPVTVVPDAVRRAGDRATATLRVTWTLPGGVPWSYDAPVTVVRQRGGSWAVSLPADASPWHPRLKKADRLVASRTWGTRGDLLDRSGTALMPLGKVYPVQLDPSRATPETARQLEAIVGEPSGSLVAKLAAAQKAGSKSPIPVITYRQSDFDSRRDRLDTLKGVIYPARQQPLAPTRTFGQPLLGSFGPVSAEQVASGKGRYTAGDYAGTSGLQGQYDATLGGTPGITVTASSAPGTPLFQKAAVDGKDVKTTLDPKVQQAAEKALTGTGNVPSALVAVDVRTGDVLASANSPELGLDRAITGRYPPGSSLKVATSYALLTGGKVTPTTPVTCPKTFVVDGRSYKNFEGEELGTPDFADDFAHSCNTAFVQLSTKLGDGDLAAAGKALGIGAGWAKLLGVDGAFEGSIPTNNGKTDKAAASIGQGRNLVSPLALAVMAGSVARGAYVPPALVTDPAPQGADRSPQQLDAGVVDQLRGLMGRVVTDGTATVLRGTPGGTVSGKTGTAEFGTGNPPKTHAWFIGYQGDLAFAVLVEEGRSGGEVAAPIAKAFLTTLAGG